MAVIDIARFGPVYFDGRRLTLPPDASLGITNVRIGGEELEAARPPVVIPNVWTPVPPITRRPYIYRTGSHSNKTARMWAFYYEVDIARTPTQGDWEDRICLTDWPKLDNDTLAPPSYAPKVISRSIAEDTDVALYQPNDWRYLGVPSPSLAPSVTGIIPATAVIIKALEVEAIFLYRTYKDIPDWTSVGAPGDGDSNIQLLDGVDGEHIFGGFIPGQRMVVTKTDFIPPSLYLTSTLNSAGITSIQVTTTIPIPTFPETGSILVRRDTPLNDDDWVTVEYTSFSGDTFTVESADFSGANVATAGNRVEFWDELYEQDYVQIAAPNADRSIGDLNQSLKWYFDNTDIDTNLVMLWRLPKDAIAYIQGHDLQVGEVLRVTQVTVNPEWFSDEVMNLAPSSGLERYAVPSDGRRIKFVGEVSCVVEPPGLPVVWDNDGLFAVGTAPNPLALSASSNAGAGTVTGTVTATPIAGQQPYSYSWAWLSGGTGLTLANTSSPTVGVSRTYSASEEAFYGGVLRVTVEDAVATVATSDVTVGVTIIDAPIGGLNVSISPNPITDSVDTASAGTWTEPVSVTATLNGIAIDYTLASISWTWETQPAGGYAFSDSAVQSPNITYSYAQDDYYTHTGRLRCTVTDEYGNSGYAEADVSVDYTTSGTFTVTPTDFGGTNANFFDYAYAEFSGGTLSDYIVLTPSGGVGPFSYVWSASGDTDEINFSSQTNNHRLAQLTYSQGDIYNKEFTISVTVTDDTTGKEVSLSWYGLFTVDPA